MRSPANFGFGFLVVVACVTAYFAGSTLFKSRPAPHSAREVPGEPLSTLVIEPASLRVGEVWESVARKLRL